VDVVGPTPKSEITIREMARVAATDAVGRAVGFLAGSAEPEWATTPLEGPAHSPALDVPSRAARTPPAAGAAGGAGGEADAVERVAEGAAELRLEESDEDALALESNDSGDSHGMPLEGDAGGGLLV
jgi:hypothetical protein